MNKTTIEYLDYTWNPIAMRCAPISGGCSNCWHLRMCDRLATNPNFSDEIRAAYAGKSPPRIIEKRLEEPGHTKKGGIVGVQFMGDLFHDDVPEEEIMKVFDVILDTPHHTYQILTKRPQRMKWIVKQFTDYIVEQLPSNIWLGVTAENQETADERIPWLLKTPAAVRFVSVEPMLGPVDLRNINGALASWWQSGAIDCVDAGDLHWLIVGGETGHGAREMKAEWAISLYEQCRGAGVPFFFKKPGDAFRGDPHDLPTAREYPNVKV